VASTARRLAALTWLVRAGLAMAALGLVWMNWPSQPADASYVPRIEAPAFTARPRPRVIVDDGHLNAHTSSDRLRPLVRLLERDGLRVLTSDGRITAGILRGGELFVTANALGYAGLAQHAANLAGLERSVHLNVDAFSESEVRELADWVEHGGGALIVADHAPAGAATRKLAAAFGVTMTNWWAEDRGSMEITFTRGNGGLGDHAILNGRSSAERVNAVVAFSGQALVAPADTGVLLRLSADAREYPFRQSREDEGRSAGGLAQGVAVRHGRGRVVILGEAAMISAQRASVPGEPARLIGMNRTDVDNQQFALNIVHWLMGLID
jgi:hypothetical protein